MLFRYLGDNHAVALIQLGQRRGKHIGLILNRPGAHGRWPP
jgi:hypothetical protein